MISPKLNYQAKNAWYKDDNNNTVNQMEKQTQTIIGQNKNTIDIDHIPYNAYYSTEELLFKCNISITDQSISIIFIEQFILRTVQSKITTIDKIKLMKENVKTEVEMRTIPINDIVCVIWSNIEKVRDHYFNPSLYVEMYPIEIYLNNGKSFQIAFLSEDEITTINTIQGNANEAANTDNELEINGEKIIYKMKYDNEKSTKEKLEKRKKFSEFISQHCLKEYAPFIQTNDRFDNRFDALIEEWSNGNISNTEFLMQLNLFSGFSYRNFNRYPCLPFLKIDYTKATSERRDLSYHYDAQTPEQREFINIQYKSIHFQKQQYVSNALLDTMLCPTITPWKEAHFRIQNGPEQISRYKGYLSFNIPHGGECTCLWYSLPSIFDNVNDYTIEGTDFEGKDIELIEKHVLPNYVFDSFHFVLLNRDLLESDETSANLSKWVDLIWGFCTNEDEKIKYFNVYLQDPSSCSPCKQLFTVRIPERKFGQTYIDLQSIQVFQPISINQGIKGFLNYNQKDSIVYLLTGQQLIALQSVFSKDNNNKSQKTMQNISIVKDKTINLLSNETNSHIEIEYNSNARSCSLFESQRETSKDKPNIIMWLPFQQKLIEIAISRGFFKSNIEAKDLNINIDRMALSKRILSIYHNELIIIREDCSIEKITNIKSNSSSPTCLYFKVPSPAKSTANCKYISSDYNSILKTLVILSNECIFVVDPFTGEFHCQIPLEYHEKDNMPVSIKLLDTPCICVQFTKCLYVYRIDSQHLVQTNLHKKEEEREEIFINEFHPTSNDINITSICSIELTGSQTHLAIFTSDNHVFIVNPTSYQELEQEDETSKHEKHRDLSKYSIYSNEVPFTVSGSIYNHNQSVIYITDCDSSYSGIYIPLLRNDLSKFRK